MAAFGGLGAGLATASVFLAGVSPTQAANFATQPDMQVAVFMVPLTLLVLVLLFEVARFVWRAPPPAQPSLRAPRPTDWAISSDAA